MPLKSPLLTPSPARAAMLASLAPRVRTLLSPSLAGRCSDAFRASAGPLPTTSFVAIQALGTPAGPGAALLQQCRSRTCRGGKMKTKMRRMQRQQQRKEKDEDRRAQAAYRMPQEPKIVRAPPPPPSPSRFAGASRAAPRPGAAAAAPGGGGGAGRDGEPPASEQPPSAP
mmetsp:Transcript_21683/g.49636  ORF Transcript_21683/g.49636 Transcript_21683/m.49636 type:complete len:170 (-) Transcript_21683:59-568(-)